MDKIRQKSQMYFHVLPENLNCAQAILKGFQKEFCIADNEIEEYRAWGGGRAKDGICGALFAADCLLGQIGKGSVSEEFKEKAGSVFCSEIKGNRLTCAACVQIADELVEKAFLSI
jgi:hypothetical protein